MPPPQTVVTTRRGVGFADPYRNLAGGSKASVALADENGVPPVEYDWPEDRVRTEQGKQLMKVTNDIRLRGLNPEDVEAEAFERYDLGELQNVSTGFHVYTGFVDGEIYRRKYADDPRYVHTEKEKKDRTFVGRLIDCPMETTLDDEEVPLEDPTRVNSVRGSTSRKDRKQVTIEADGLSVCKLWTTSFSGREEPPEGCQRKYRYLLHEDDPVDVNKLNSRMLPAVFYRGEHVVAHGTFINIATPDYSNLKSVPVAYEDAYVTASGATAIVEAMSGRLVNSQLRTYVRTERKKEAARQRTEGDAAFEARKKKKFTFSEATAPNTGQSVQYLGALYALTMVQVLHLRQSLVQLLYSPERKRSMLRGAEKSAKQVLTELLEVTALSNTSLKCTFLPPIPSAMSFEQVIGIE